jgi:hypothetical protein
MKIIVNTLGIMALILAISIACNENKKIETVEPSIEKGKMILHIHSMLDTAEITKADSVYLISPNDKIWLSEAQILLHQFSSFKRNGEPSETVQNLIPVSYKSYIYTPGNLLPGNYGGYELGLHTKENLSQTPYFIPYKESNNEIGAYLHFKGIWYKDSDTLAFEYRLGGVNNAIALGKKVAYYSMIPNKGTILHLNINYMSLLRAIDPSQSPNYSITTEAENNSDNAKKIIKILPTIFESEE